MAQLGSAQILRSSPFSVPSVMMAYYALRAILKQSVDVHKHHGYVQLSAPMPLLQLQMHEGELQYEKSTR